MLIGFDGANIQQFPDIPAVYMDFFKLTGGQTLCEVRLGVTNDGETDSRQSNKLTDTTAKRFSVT
jgi:hypothetical protein